MVSAPDAGWMVIGLAWALLPISTMVIGLLAKRPGRVTAPAAGGMTEGSLRMTAPATFTSTSEVLGRINTVPALVIRRMLLVGTITQPMVGPIHCRFQPRKVPPWSRSSWEPKARSSALDDRP